MRYGFPSWMTVKSTEGAVAVWEEARRIFSRPPPPRAADIIPDARPIGTFENQGGGPLTVRRVIR